ncbi:MAG: energy transducer TonB [Planctomycetota bacterium]|jgi:protein TonB
MRLALVASFLFHACAFALLPWSAMRREEAAFARFASAASEPVAQPKPKPSEPVETQAEPLPVESYELPRVEEPVDPMPELEPAPRLPRPFSALRHYRLKKPLTIHRKSAPESAPHEARTAPPVASTPARLIRGTQTPPRYPSFARRRAWQGTVLLELTIGAGGAVEAVVLKKSSGYALLDREAMRVARTWRYEPGTRNGRAAASTLVQPVEFRLR